jgi:hypothetical protein
MQSLSLSIEEKERTVLACFPEPGDEVKEFYETDVSGRHTPTKI